MTSPERTDRDQGNVYSLTGEIIREWVKLELLLSLWLTDLLGIDEFRSRVLWNSYGDLRSKLNLLKTLVRNFADESLWEEARGIFANSEKIAEDRFILAHTFGDVDAAAGKLTFISDKVDADFIVNFVGEKAIGTDSLRSWRRDIGECQNSIREFKGKLGNQVHEKSLVQRRQSSS
jgi:hypothetical protein